MPTLDELSAAIDQQAANQLPTDELPNPDADTPDPDSEPVAAAPQTSPQEDVSASVQLPPVTNQAEWNALPAWQKDIYRMHKQGITLTQAQAGKYAMNFLNSERNKPKTSQGKILTDTATQKLNALQLVDQSLPMLKAAYDKIRDRVTTGPIGNKFAGKDALYDPDYNDLNSQVNQLVPMLARGVFGEVGVLTDEDVRRYANLLPNAATDPKVADRLFDTLKQKLKIAKRTTVKTFKDAGYNVQGFEDLLKDSDEQPSVAQASQPASPAGIKEGQTATNPKTGAKIVYRSGSWVPLQ
jgi:hypothetical protein